jgi:hypothetical protein
MRARGTVGYDHRVRLAQVEHVELPEGIMVQTRDALRSYGLRGYEGLVLWAGVIDGPIAFVRQAIIPEQNAIRSENGVGYFVESPVLFKLSRFLEKERLRLLAQVHSHPTEAYHSETDDRYAIVTEDGGFSLVVPDFAARPMTLDDCAIYRLRKGDWLELEPRSVAATFRVV